MIPVAAQLPQSILLSTSANPHSCLCRSELSKLANQDITIRDLEQRIEDFESTIEAQVAERLVSKERELRRAFESELEGVREAETAAEGRVAALQIQVADAVAARDEAQASLYAARARVDDELSMRQAETDAVVAENARLRDQYAQLSAQYDDARRRLVSAAAAADDGSTASSASGHVASIDAGYSSLRAQLEVHRSRAEAADEECNRLSAALAQVQEESKRWGEVLDAQRRMHEEGLADLHARLASREADVTAMRRELQGRPSHAEVAHLRHQLVLLQSMHFNAGGDDDALSGGDGGKGGVVGSDGTGGGGDGGGSGTGEVVEVTTLMLRRIRQLEGKVVKAETEKTELEGEINKIRSDLDAANDTINDQKALIQRLEDAISRGSAAGDAGLNQSAFYPSQGQGSFAANATEAPQSPSRNTNMSAQTQLDAILSQPGARIGVGGFGSPGSVGGHGGPASSSGGALASASMLQSPRRDSLSIDMGPLGSPDNGGNAGDVSLINVLKAQRERFRIRCLELETEAQARDQQLAEASGRVSKLTADNGKMYEKIRFLQSFLQSGPDSSGVTDLSRLEMGINSNTSGGNITVNRAELRSRAANAPFSINGEDGFEAGYRKWYQDSLDPFENFARQQRQKQYAKLSAGDRLTLRGSRLLFGNRHLRLGLLAYAAALHLLVWFTMWHFTHASHNGGCEPGSSASFNTGPAANVPPGLARG